MTPSEHGVAQTHSQQPAVWLFLIFPGSFGACLAHCWCVGSGCRGLLRGKKANGSYERCQPHHSWNSNHVFSNLLLYHLERHSDHHAHPTRHYQSLRNFDDVPALPNGYFGAYLMAYCPPIWFAVMDPRLLNLQHIQGDLSKVNILPGKREAIEQKYAALVAA